jgi:hypothetical protein
MSEKLVVLKEAELTTNCPECFNKSLRLAFYQKHVFGKLFHRTTNQVTHQMTCNTCKSDIYPGIWTDDIDRLFNYYQKMVKPEKSSLKPTSLFYVLLVILMALVSIGYYVYSAGIIQF